ncbi:MAG: GAF domain-containing protein [Solirubrobacteraceae bacterium]
MAVTPLEDSVPRIAPSLDVQEVLTEIVTEATSLLKAETGDLILKDARKSVFRIVAASRHAPGVIGQEYPLDKGLAARVLEAGRTLIVPDYSHYKHRIDTIKDYGFAAMMSSPLIARGETIGVLTVEHIDPEAMFSDEDARLLTAFANHAAVALDNAHRYENEVALARDLGRANDELSRSLLLQRRLVDQVLADRGPAAVAEELARLLERPVVLQDRFLRPIAGACPDSSEDWHQLALAHAGPLHGALRRRLDDLARDWRPALLGEPLVPGPTRLVAPVAAGHQDVAGFLVIRWEGEPTDLDLALIEVAATGVALELLKISARAEVEQTVRGDLATDLVNGAYSGDDVIVARAARMGYDLADARDVILLQVDAVAETGLPEHDLLRLKRRVFEAVTAEVSADAPASIVAALDDRVLVLAAQCARQDGGYGEREPRSIAEALSRRLRRFFGELSFSASVGDRCTGPREYAASFDLARSALGAMVKLGKRGLVIDARELGMYRLMIEAAEHPALRAHVEATLAPLTSGGRRGRELLETLEAYIASGFNQRETARRSYVHINTVANRLERIGTRLNRDLSDPETLVELALAVRLAKLLDIV